MWRSSAGSNQRASIWQSADAGPGNVLPLPARPPGPGRLISYELCKMSALIFPTPKLISKITLMTRLAA